MVRLLRYAGVVRELRGSYAGVVRKTVRGLYWEIFLGNNCDADQFTFEIRQNMVSYFVTILLRLRLYKWINI